MSDYLLIHGGAHGAWCWDRVVPCLQASDKINKVVAVDLLADAQAAVGKPREEITTSDYVEGVIHTIDRHQLSDIVLVGHSMAGVTVPAVAHRVPGLIRHVVYLATTNPPAGQSISDMMEHPLSPVSRGLGFDEMFCSDLDPATADWLKGNLREDPPRPYHDRVEVCKLPDAMPSTYVVCLRDMALPVAFQLEQAGNAAVEEVVEFDSGHSAFASKPKELSELLMRYA